MEDVQRLHDPPTAEPSHQHREGSHGATEEAERLPLPLLQYMGVHRYTRQRSTDVNEADIMHGTDDAKLTYVDGENGKAGDTERAGDTEGAGDIGTASDIEKTGDTERAGDIKRNDDTVEKAGDIESKTSYVTDNLQRQTLGFAGGKKEDDTDENVDENTDNGENNDDLDGEEKLHDYMDSDLERDIIEEDKKRFSDDLDANNDDNDLEYDEVELDENASTDRNNMEEDKVEILMRGKAGKERHKPCDGDEKRILTEADPEGLGMPTAPEESPGVWGWLVCLTSVTAFGIVFGNINAFGILYVALLERFGTDDQNIAFKTSWVGSVCLCLTFLMSTVGGVLIDQLGLRRVAVIGGILAFVGMLSSAFVQELTLLYLTYGVLMGLGFAFVFVTAVVIRGHYFKRRLGLANGLGVLAATVCSSVLSLALPVALDNIGLRNTFLALSGGVFLQILCALTWKPKVKRSRSAEVTASAEVKGEGRLCGKWCSKVINVRIFRNRNYVIWCVAQTVAIFGYFVPFVHLVKHSKDVFPSSSAHLLPMCISIASGLACILAGLIADMKCSDRLYIQQASLFVLGLSTVCIPAASSFAGLVVICLVIGACDGTFITTQGAICFELVGPVDASQALGFLYGAMSLPLTVGFPLAGLLYDALGSYTVAFYVAGSLPVLGAFIMVFIRHDTQVLLNRAQAELRLRWTMLNRVSKRRSLS